MHPAPSVNPWAALVGRRDAGRVRVALGLAQALTGRGIAVGGFVHVRVDDGEVHRGHDLLDVATGARRPLARVTASDPDLCDYAFAADGFAAAAALLAGPGEVLLAEAGRLEANGHGHWPAIQAALEGPPAVLVLCLRPQSAAPVALKLTDPVAGLELPADDAAVSAFVAAVAAAHARLGSTG
jgi:nucleoside-triphosphatase THEP1